LISEISKKGNLHTSLANIFLTDTIFIGPHWIVTDRKRILNQDRGA